MVWAPMQNHSIREKGISNKVHYHSCNKSGTNSPMWALQLCWQNDVQHSIKTLITPIKIPLSPPYLTPLLMIRVFHHVFKIPKALQSKKRNIHTTNAVWDFTIIKRKLHDPRNISQMRNSILCLICRLTPSPLITLYKILLPVSYSSWHGLISTHCHRSNQDILKWLLLIFPMWK